MEVITACTNKVDDIEAAVEEMLSQIDKTTLKANSLGIAACHYEFVLSGVAEAVCKAMPFEVVGTISSTQATDTALGVFEFALTVLTADDVCFASVLTPSLAQNPEEAIEQSYASILAQAGGEGCDIQGGLGDPKLILLHAPFMFNNSGDAYLNVINRVSNNAPLFGAFAVDDTQDFRYCFSLYNGQYHNDRMVLTAVYGNIEPRFYVANISPNQILGEPALVTKSEAQLLIELNGRPVFEYFSDMGLAEAVGTQYAMSSLPFLLEYGDGAPPVSRVFIGLTPDGSAVLNGSAPRGLTISIGSFDKEDVLFTTAATVDAALEDALGNASLVLAYSCIARSMSLGVEQLLEAELVKSRLTGKLPFMMAYAGGEFCPMQSSDSGVVNRFHNNTLILCVL